MISQTVRRLLDNGGVIAVAMAVMNLGTFGFTLVAAWLLVPGQYGAFGAVMNLLLVISVASLGIQATAARRIAADPQHVAQIESAILTLTKRVVLPIGVVLLALSPLVTRLLKLDSNWPAVVVAVASVPLTLFGAQAGILQGERRWVPLAWMYVANGVPRLLIGTLMLLGWGNETSALIGVAIGMVAPTLVGGWVLRGVRPGGQRSKEHGARAIVSETVHNSQALLAYFALSNLDIVVARNVVEAHDSGLYAAGLIVTKIMVFLPQFVVVVAFPTMATPAERIKALARGLGLIAVLGGLGTGAIWLFSEYALSFGGEGSYLEVQPLLWRFALLGTVLAMLQLLVYSALAQQAGLASIVMWVGLAAMVAIGLTTSTVAALVTVVLVVDTVLLVLLLALAVRPGAPTPDAPDVTTAAAADA